MLAAGRVEIDLAALARNYSRLSEAAAPGACGAVVKANAYGLGAEPICEALYANGCRHFFVATINEALQLRELRSDIEILVLNGLQSLSNEVFSDAGLIPVLNSRRELSQWGSAGPAAVHLDTGMSRLGLSADDVGALKLEADRAPRIDARYVMTHLACADEPGHALNAVQIESFNELRTLWPDARTSIGNSAGTFLGGDFKSDLARPGIALYGGNPFHREASPVESVVTVRARILQLRDISPGTSVGYGASFVAETGLRIATVALGYADGYLRSLGNCGIGEVSGRRVPVIGRVSMDFVCLDVSEIPREAVREGDWATLIGGSVTIDEVAALAGTISYELLTALGDRLERVYSPEASGSNT